MKRTIWKRGCSLLFTLILVIGLMPMTALADGVTGPIPDGLQLNGTIVTGYTGTDTELEIPEGVTEIGSSAFLNSTVQEVTLPSTLTTIGEYAFTRSALTSITIPASVTTIEAHAFTKTKSLTYAVIQGNPTLGNNAFSESGIKSIKMDQVTDISYQCFYASSLSSISMDSVESIGSNAFYSTNLAELSLPDTVTSIDANFWGVYSVEKLTVPLSVLLRDGIHSQAFGLFLPNVEVVLTGVDQDITLLKEGFSVGGKEYAFSSLCVTTVQDPTSGTITNQTGADVTVVSGSEETVIKAGNVKPVGSDAASDAYLSSLTPYVSGNYVTLEPGFQNTVYQYTTSVGDEKINIEFATSHPSATVTINGTPVSKSSGTDDYLIAYPLDEGDNLFTIVVTAPDGKTQRTYTLMVTRDAMPKAIQISTAAELMDFAAKINDGIYPAASTADMVVELTADIDMSGCDWVPIGVNSTTISQYFAGTFDGNDHTISNLSMSNDSACGNYLGLFGVTMATIRDVHVSGVLEVIHPGTMNYYFGSIAGYLYAGEITGCTSAITVTGLPTYDYLYGYVMGGIVGFGYNAYLENCVSSTSVSGYAGGCLGGIAGYAKTCEIINCRNEGDFTITGTNGQTLIGGIAGQIDGSSTLDHCVNNGKISQTSIYPSDVTVGGICGYMKPTDDSCTCQITNCTNNGSVETQAQYAAGIVGRAGFGDGICTIKSCLNNGAISSTTYTSSRVSGLTSNCPNPGSMTACISLGSLSVTSTSAIVHPVAAVASVDADFDISSNYYDSSLTTQGKVSDVVTAGSTGKPLTELETETFIQQVNAEGGNFRLDADGNIEVVPLSYTLTVAGSYADVSGAGEHEEGEQVTIDAGTRPGYRFAGWTATSGTIANPSASRTTFTMPDEDATVTASWEYVPITTYPITVKDAENGTVTCYAHGAAKDAEVTLHVKADVGYQLASLTVTDADGNARAVTKVDEKTYTFVMPACAVTVEAVFAPTTVEPSGLPFTDVSTSDWFYDAVKFVYENGLMDGVGSNLFAPNAVLTRAMAVTILYRLEGSPAVTTDAGFNDVAAGTWYTDAVNWAAANNIVNGVENNNFNPTGSLTREQMATVLYRYAQYKGVDVSASGDISGFADSANVSSWAVDAVKWAVGSGLVNGVEGNALAPQGTSTRAQAATVLMRLSGHLA